jgi:hypothetical protein
LKLGFYIYVCECVCIERAGWTGGKVSEPRRKVLEIDLNVSKTALWAFHSGHEAKIVWVSEWLEAACDDKQLGRQADFVES